MSPKWMFWPKPAPTPQIDYGPKYTFNAATTTQTEVCCMSAEHTLVAWISPGFTTYVNLLTVSGTSVSMGTPVALSSSTSSHHNRPITICKLSDTRAIIIYFNVDGPYSYARVLKLESGVLTVGSALLIGTWWGYHAFSSKVSDTKLIYAYCNHGAGNDGAAQCISLGGAGMDEMTLGTVSTFHLASLVQSQNFAIATVNETQAVATTSTPWATHAANYAYLLDIDGLSITAGSAVTVRSSPPNQAEQLYACKHSDNRAIICSINDLYQGVAHMITASEGNITVGQTPGGQVYNVSAAGVEGANQSRSNCIKMINSNLAVVGWAHNSGCLRFLHVDGTNIVPAEYFYYNADNYPPSYTATSHAKFDIISPEKAVLCYADDGNGGHGTVQTVTITVP